MTSSRKRNIFLVIAKSHPSTIWFRFPAGKTQGIVSLTEKKVWLINQQNYFFIKKPHPRPQKLFIFDYLKRKKQQNFLFLLQVSDVTQNIRKVGPILDFNCNAHEKVGPNFLIPFIFVYQPFFIFVFLFSVSINPIYVVITGPAFPPVFLIFIFIFSCLFAWLAFLDAHSKIFPF